MSDFVQGIMLGVALALAAGALAMYLSRVNAAPPGQVEEPTGRKADEGPKPLRERRP